MFAQRIFISLTLLGFVSFTAIEFFPSTIIGFGVLTNKSIETELIMLQLIFRHGERAPLWQYPTDPNNQSFWNRFGGLGELTDNGKKQCYNYGGFLREIYGDFLSPNYDEKQVMIKSTHYLRIIKTAQLIVSGLYKPKNATNWNEQSAPLPTPNATLQQLWNIPNCARYDQLLSQVLKSAEFNKSIDYYKDTINAANKYSGNAKNDIFSIGGIADTVYIEKANNLTLPKWVQEHYRKIQESSDTVYHFIYRTPEMAKYITGRILNDINMNILRKIEGHLAPLQLILYSSHDTLVAPLIKQLGLVENTTKPEFLATVFMELRRAKGNGKSKFFVQVLLKDNEPDQPINLRKVTITGCEELCPLEDFERIISNKVVIDMVKECALKP